MNIGRSIRLFLVDGTPNGLLTAEIMNWSGHVLTGPRSKLAELVQRPECARTGIYFLVGADPADSLLTRVYIGESDDVAQRLKDHNRPDAQGGKDFWERACLVTSKDQNLTKAHAKYLESKLIAIAKEAGRCAVGNATAHDYCALPESDRSDMAYFLEQIRIVLPLLGFDFLRDLIKPSALAGAAQAAQVTRSPPFKLVLAKHGIRATAQELDGEFFVLKGSLARREWTGVDDGYQHLHQQLVASGVLLANDPNHRTFADDCAFKSPSAAAAVVTGRSANGRTEWVTDSGQTYASWQDQQLAAQTPTAQSPA